MLFDNGELKVIWSRVEEIRKQVLVKVTFDPEFEYTKSQDETVEGKYIWLFVVPEVRLKVK
jgi:hypothetical protein